MHAVLCHDLHKTYPVKPPVEAVRGIDLEIPSGACFGVLGPNGAGKTTTIEILEGLLPASSGEVQILGMRWEEQAEQIRQEIGISLQETQLSEKLTVRETLRLFRSFYHSGLDPDNVTERVSLQEKADTWVKNLSGGQRQRLAVAAALVGDPQLLFLDEPTTGLDPQLRRELWEIIADFRRQGRTVLLTTHYMEEAERLCDRVAVVDRGKVIAMGSPQELIATLGGEHMIELTLEDDCRGAALDSSQLPDVQAAHVESERVRLSVGQPHVALPALLSAIERSAMRLSSLTTRHASLDDVFVELTGRRLDDDESV